MSFYLGCFQRLIQIEQGQAWMERVSQSHIVHHIQCMGESTPFLLKLPHLRKE
jgi:hypothetical protein